MIAVKKEHLVVAYAISAKIEEEKEKKEEKKEEVKGQPQPHPKQDLINLLHIAATRGTTEVVERIIEKNPKLINEKDHNGQTALMLATMYGHAEIVQYLLAKDRIDVNLKDNYGQTALMIAAKKEYLPIMTELLIAGARPDLLDPYVQDAIDKADQNGRMGDSVLKLRTLTQEAQAIDEILNLTKIKDSDFCVIIGLMRDAGDKKDIFDYIDNIKYRPILSRCLLHISSDQGIGMIKDNIDLFMSKKNLSKVDYKERSPLQVAVDRATNDARMIPLVEAIAAKMNEFGLEVSEPIFPQRSLFSFHKEADYNRNVKAIRAAIELVRKDKKEYLKKSDFEVKEKKGKEEVTAHGPTTTAPTAAPHAAAPAATPAPEPSAAHDPATSSAATLPPSTTPSPSSSTGVMGKDGKEGRSS